VPFSTAVPQKAVLDIEHCLLCGKCEKACPVEPSTSPSSRETSHQVGAIILATGFELTPPDAKS
jgi:heterodisulfide reductase subunit A2